jgi:hypothetical protein
MNKKKYIIPSMRVDEVKVAQIICTSGLGDAQIPSGGGTNGGSFPGGGDAKHRHDDDFDFGGSDSDWGDGIW